MMSQRMMISYNLLAARADVLARNKDLVSIQMFSNWNTKKKRKKYPEHIMQRKRIASK